MQNKNYEAINATGLSIRITTLQNGRARIYLADSFEEFFRNWNAAPALTALAPKTRSGSHLDRAMARLVERISEIIADHEVVELSAIMPIVASTKREPL